MFGRTEGTSQASGDRDSDSPMTLDEYTRLSNRARFLEEASHGIYVLLERNGKSRSWLAKRLGRSRAFVTKILEGSHNFTLETLADVYLALGKSAHLTLGSDPDELRLPVDEEDVVWLSYIGANWQQTPTDPIDVVFEHITGDRREYGSSFILDPIARSLLGLGKEFTVADEATQQDTLASRVKLLGSDVL